MTFTFATFGQTRAFVNWNKEPQKNDEE